MRKEIKAGYIWIVLATGWQDGMHRENVAIRSKAFDNKENAANFMMKYDGWSEMDGYDIDISMQNKLVPFEEIDKWIGKYDDWDDKNDF